MRQSPAVGFRFRRGKGNPLEVLKFADGTAAGRSDGAFNGRPTFAPKQLRILELRYGTIRALALTPRESLDLIEHSRSRPPRGPAS
ncbi:hypothetical protein LRR80_04654 [Streptomyces sp. RO-S4]|nr:hypothetical protein [Streptomyces sp. RO-S4]